MSSISNARRGASIRGCGYTPNGMMDLRKALTAILSKYMALGLYLWIGISLIILVNIALLIAFSIRDFLAPEPEDTIVERELRLSSWGVVYPHRQPDEIRALLTETWNRPQIYSPLTQFRERPSKGTYVNVEPFHLFRYLDEETFRYNTRKTDDGSRFQRAAGNIVGKRLTYAQLIGVSTRPA